MNNSTINTTRRQVIKTLGSLGAVSPLSACSDISSILNKNYERPHSRTPFYAPRIARNKIVRVIVGLRPYRPSGFVVKREEYDEKKLSIIMVMVEVVFHYHGAHLLWRFIKQQDYLLIMLL